MKSILFFFFISYCFAAKGWKEVDNVIRYEEGGTNKANDWTIETTYPVKTTQKFTVKFSSDCCLSEKKEFDGITNRGGESYYCDSCTYKYGQLAFDFSKKMTNEMKELMIQLSQSRVGVYLLG